MDAGVLPGFTAIADDIDNPADLFEPNLDSGKRRLPATLESVQGPERIKECVSFRVITRTVCYLLEALVDCGFRNSDSF